MRTAVATVRIRADQLKVMVSLRGVLSDRPVMHLARFQILIAISNLQPHDVIPRMSAAPIMEAAGWFGVLMPSRKLHCFTSHMILVLVRLSDSNFRLSRH